MMLVRFLLLVCCVATATCNATIGYRGGQALSRATTAAGKRYFTSPTNAAQQNVSNRLAQLNTESQLQRLGEQRLSSGKNIINSGEMPSGITPAGRNIRSEYLGKGRPTVQSKPLNAQAPQWNAADVSQNFVNANELAVAGALGAGAAATGYLIGTNTVKSRDEMLQNKKAWANLDVQGEMPEWFTRQKFEQARKAISRDSNDQAILNYVRSRELFSQNMQVNRIIKEKFNDSAVVKELFYQTKKSNPGLMPLAAFELAQQRMAEQKEKTNGSSWMDRLRQLRG